MTICCTLQFQYQKLLVDAATLQNNKVFIIKESCLWAAFLLSLFCTLIQNTLLLQVMYL